MDIHTDNCVSIGDISLNTVMVAMVTLLGLKFCAELKRMVQTFLMMHRNYRQIVPTTCISGDTHTVAMKKYLRDQICLRWYCHILTN